MNWIDQRPDDAMAGAFEAIGPTPVETIAPEPFREAMACIGTAVHVVTTAGSAGRTGFTATSVCSVSDRPATLLVCLNRRSQITPVIRENGVFCVNTLAADCEEIADVFAGRTSAFMDDRFKVGDWLALKTGAPVLRSAVVAFDCRTVEVKAVATHNVFIAGVEAIHFGQPRHALVYHERAYKKV